MTRTWRGRGRATRRTIIGGALGVAGAALLGGGAGRAVAADVEARVDGLLARLPLAEQVAQLFVFEARGTTMTPGYAERLARERPGGVLFVGANVGDPADVGPFVEAIHASNPVVPPLVAVDQEGGPVTRLPGDPAPSAPELGQRPDGEVLAAAEARANFLRSFRFDVNFAPVADVAYAPTSSMVYRSFGSDPTAVATKVAAVIAGTRRTRLLSAAKHFPGHGRTALDSHLALPEVELSLNDWLETDALPFRAAVEAGVQLVMLGHLRFRRWDDAPTSLSKPTIDVLRGVLGFGGVVVTDDLGMAALAGLDPFAVVDQAVAAGVDLLLYATPPAPAEELMAHLRRRVEAGEVPLSRLEESLRRVLRLKVSRFGL